VYLGLTSVLTVPKMSVLLHFYLYWWFALNLFICFSVKVLSSLIFTLLYVDDFRKKKKWKCCCCHFFRCCLQLHGAVHCTTTVMIYSVTCHPPQPVLIAIPTQMQMRIAVRREAVAGTRHQNRQFRKWVRIFLTVTFRGTTMATTSPAWSRLIMVIVPWWLDPVHRAGRTTLRRWLWMCGCNHHQHCTSRYHHHQLHHHHYYFYFICVVFFAFFNVYFLSCSFLLLLF